MTTEEAEKLSLLAHEAIIIQDASNLSGLVHGWARSITQLRELLPEASTEALNRHPINKMWASKLNDLAGMGYDIESRYAVAYSECRKLAGLE